jgi:hypothetical protein
MVLLTSPQLLLTIALIAAGPFHGLVEAVAQPVPPADDQLTILSVDVRTLPEWKVAKPEAAAPQWRTSFGSERRSEVKAPKPSAGVEADIVLLQGVSDVRRLRSWFPAGQWRLITSRHFARSDGDGVDDEAAASSVPSPATAVALRLRPGLRVTGKDQVLAVTDASGKPAAAATVTAVKIRYENRETWAVSVLLPEDCAVSCPERTAIDRWHETRSAENVRRVTGGRLTPQSPGCDGFGLRLDPPPPPPRLSYVAASLTPKFGCAATVSVAK